MNMIIYLIVAAEVLFWIFIVLGLVARYILRQDRLSKVLLSSTIVVDLFLLIITSFHLHSGGESEIAHGIAAVYIAVSIAFGKQMIQWFDDKFQSLLLKRQSVPKRYGLDYAKHYLKSFIRHILAFIIAFILISLMHLIASNDSAKALYGIFNVWKVVLCVDLIIAMSYFIWPKTKKV